VRSVPTIALGELVADRAGSIDPISERYPDAIFQIELKEKVFKQRHKTFHRRYLQFFAPAPCISAKEYFSNVPTSYEDGFQQCGFPASTRTRDDVELAHIGKPKRLEAPKIVNL